MNDDLQTAAESYAADRLILYPFPPESPELYRLLLEVAFIKGSIWHTQLVAERLNTRFKELRANA